MKVALDGLSPQQIVVARLVLGAAVLTALVLLTKRRWPRDVWTWVHLTVMGVLLGVAPFLLYAWASQHIDSGLASIYNATTPVVTLLFALIAIPDERTTTTKMAGLAIAAIGVVIVASPSVFGNAAQSGDSLLAQLACLGAATCYGAGFVYARRFLRTRTVDPIVVAAGQITTAAVISLFFLPFGGLTPVDLTPAVLASVVVLGAAGTGIAYVWNTQIIQGWGATSAASVTYLIPIIGVLLGVLVLRETVTWNEPLGAVLVIAGIALTRLTVRQATTSP